MRLGLIARCETARGIAIQSKNFYDHMPVDSVLLVRMPRPDCAEAPEWYDWRHTTTATYNPVLHRLDEDLVRGWLRDLDVVFTVETPNDWRIPLWCREMGVKLVIQGNPEFVRHGMAGFEDLPHPDSWWWPTSWRRDLLPPGELMPVPMDRVGVREPDGKLRVLHVMGKRAYQDRNGTEILVQMVRLVRSDIVLTVYGIDGQLPEFRRQRNVELRLHPMGVEDNWRMYENQDVLVMPRRYGGLCLPALEAAAHGLVVIMPDCSPNDELAAIRTRVARWRPVTLAAGVVKIADANPSDMAGAIDAMNTPAAFREARTRQAAMLPTWDVWHERYLAALAPW